MDTQAINSTIESYLTFRTDKKEALQDNLDSIHIIDALRQKSAAAVRESQRNRSMQSVLDRASVVDTTDRGEVLMLAEHAADLYRREMVASLRGNPCGAPEGMEQDAREGRRQAIKHLAAATREIASELDLDEERVEKALNVKVGEWGPHNPSDASLDPAA
jgi:hypothetical protein